jgi:KUP system potassium uptake protein
MQLGWLPAVHIHQTSSDEYGQIYVPVVNWTMMLCTIALTIGFGSSVRLAGAYGTAVSTTMLLTTVLLYNVMRERWQWSSSRAIPLCGIFLIVDFAFFAANLLKIAQGGWIPLTFGAIIFLFMTTWRTGIEAVRQKLGAMTESTNQFFKRLADNKIPRVAGIGVFLTRMADSIPPPIIDHVAQVGALYQTLIALTVVFEEVPRVPSAERLEIVNMSQNFWHITIHYGFMEIPDLPSALQQAKGSGFAIDLKDAIYFASRDQVGRAKAGTSVMRWRLPLFAFMFRNSVRVSDLFNLPSRNFLEVGRQVEI